MSINQIQGIQNRAVNINRIVANNQQIARLESQIAVHKEVSSITKEMIANNTNSINLTKDIIDVNEKLIGQHIEHRGLLQESRDLTIESRDAQAKLLNSHIEHRGLLQESRDLTKESRDLTKESRDLTKESRDLTKESIDLYKQAEVCIEKILAIMMKNPAKYGGLDKAQTQNLPEVIETKANMVKDIVNVKSKQYPELKHVVLAETAKKAVDVSFCELDVKNLPSVREMFLLFKDNVDIAFTNRFSFEENDYRLLPFKIYFTNQNIFFDFYKSQVDDKV